jgi:hypothetical protein
VQALIVNPSFEQNQLFGVTRPAYYDATAMQDIETNVLFDQANSQFFAYNYVTAPGAAPPYNSGLQPAYATGLPAGTAGDLYRGNTNATVVGINSSTTRQPQAFIYQTVGGVGPFIRVVPSGGWTLKRPDAAGTVWTEASGALADSASGGASFLTNEDSFLQSNTESTAIAGRFYTNGLNPIDPDGPDPDNLPDLNANAAAWLADGQNAVLLRNRNNRVQVGGADAGRGVVLSQTLATSVNAGDIVTLEWLVADRIGALTLNDYDVVVRAGGTTIYSTDSVADKSLRPVNDNALTPNSGLGLTGQFANMSRTFTATAGGLLEISFGSGGLFAGAANSTAGTGDGLVAFDNIRLSVVPEPSVLGLCLLGLAGLLATRRRS